MSLIKCKKCGEMFSDSYKTCPFCEEDDAYYGGRATKRRRRAETPRRKAPSILGPVVVLVLILLVSMFSTTALAAEDEYITDFEAESEIIIEEEPTEELPEAEESSEDTSGIDISFEDDVEAGTEDAGLSDGITSGSTTVEVTGTLKEILEKGMTVSSGDRSCCTDRRRTFCPDSDAAECICHARRFRRCPACSHRNGKEG